MSTARTNPDRINADRVNDRVTGLILAGGQARRMGNVDKGLELFLGKRLVDHVYERLAPQVGGVIINANQNHDAYKTFGVRVVSDAIGNFAGPLAGLHAGLSVSRRPYLVSVPCDSPFLPVNLVERLMARLDGIRRRTRRRQDRQAAAPGVLPRAPQRARAPHQFPQRRRAQGRRLVCEPERGRGGFRRSSRGVQQHQHARGAGDVFAGRD